MHADVVEDSKVPITRGMFIGLLALQDGTCIRVLTGSHDPGHPEVKHIHKVTLSRFQYFVGHPLLVHGGCGSSILRNLRLHFYNGLPEDSILHTSFVKFRLWSQAKHLELARQKAATSKKLLTKLLRPLCRQKEEF